MKKGAFSVAFIIAALVLQLAAGAPATADTSMTYNLSGATFAGGDTATGYVTLGYPTAGPVTLLNWNVTVYEASLQNLTGVSSITLTGVGPISSGNGNWVSSTNWGALNVVYGGNGSVYLAQMFNGYQYSLVLYAPSVFSSTVPVTTAAQLVGSNLLTGNGTIEEYANAYSVEWHIIASGSLVPTGSHSAVPIPGTIWLLGSGLAGLAAFRKKLRA